LTQSKKPRIVLIGNNIIPLYRNERVTNTVIPQPDVREPHEYKDGHIPKAENMPITSSPDALFLNAEDFEERFGFPKPSADTEVVFYCKSGVRSKASATLARQAGFQTVGEYRGSWKDWSAKGGTVA
jgi:rhodanese-related sulfurtransferase